MIKWISTDKTRKQDLIKENNFQVKNTIVVFLT